MGRTRYSPTLHFAAAAVVAAACKPCCCSFDK